MSRAIKFWGVVPAAGVGKRMNADRPKQYLQLAEKNVLEQTLSRFLQVETIEAIAVAISKQDPYWPKLTISRHHRVLTATGGRERADSVLSALMLLEDRAAEDDWVLVHDAARPCITEADIRLLIESLQEHGVGGILALASHDTLKNVHHSNIVETLDRSKIWRALTPQMFRYGVLKNALIMAFKQGSLVTDEASAIELQGLQPKIIEGRPDNIKITRTEDLALANFYLEQQC